MEEEQKFKDCKKSIEEGGIYCPFKNNCPDDIKNCIVWTIYRNSQKTVALMEMADKKGIRLRGLNFGKR